MQIKSEMKLHFKYDIHRAAIVILEEMLEKLAIPYTVSGMSEINISAALSPEIFDALKLAVRKYGIEFIDDPKKVVVQQIKDVVCNMVFKEDQLPDFKISAYISDKVNLSYSSISKIFSEVTYSTIENFIILQRIERAKQLLIDENITLNEVAWKLNYSSPAHLSAQFKKTTGLTPTQFIRIIQKRKSIVIP